MGTLIFVTNMVHKWFDLYIKNTKKKKEKIIDQILNYFFIKIYMSIILNIVKINQSTLKKIQIKNDIF